jgi:hypothetical protein
MTTTRRLPRARRRLRSLAAMAAFLCAVATLAGCSKQESWFHPRTPTTFVQSSDGCPSSIGSARDVRNTEGSNQYLVPVGAHPIDGLICIYGGPLRPSARVRQVVLDQAAAVRLSAALSRVTLQAPPSGAVNCPNDTGGFAIISLSFTGSRDVNVWWTMTGCQSLDNGSIGATQIANKSFVQFSNAIVGLTN